MSKKTLLKCLLQLVALAFVANIGLAHQNVSMSKSIPNEKHLIKYLSPYTEYPVKLIDYRTKTQSSSDVTTTWHKHGCNCLIDELDSMRKYFTTETDSQTGAKDLLLLDYDKKNNSLLDHYQPIHEPENVLEYTHDDYDDTRPIVYTLAYLNDFELDVKNLNKEEFEISCRIRVLIPNGLNTEHTQDLNERLAHSIHLKMHVPDHQKSRKTQNKEIKEEGHEKNHMHHQHMHNQTSFKRSHNVEHQIQLKNRTSRTVATLYEMEMIQGPFKLYKASIDEETNITISCNLILTDYDNTHAFDSTTYKIINKNSIDSMLVPNSAGKKVVGTFCGLLLVLIASFSIRF